MELKFGISDGPGPAIEFLFWKQGEQAFLSQILAGSLLELKFGILDGPGPAIEFLFWKQGEQAFLSQILAGELFGAQIWHFGRPRAGY